MKEPSGSSLGEGLGVIAVAVGILVLGWGFVRAFQGDSVDGVDGFVFGGLAFVAGCVILVRRGRSKSQRGESDDAATSEPADAPRE